MASPEENLEQREKELESRIQLLERQLDRLSSRISDDSAIPSEADQAPAAQVTQAKAIPAEELPELSEEVLSWASRNAVLPRLATVCFLMVIALILRTITDSGVVNKLIGSGIGMAYAAALMGLGWHRYLQESPLAPVFAACGAVLMSTIVVETHMHFLSLPLVPAYLTLMATGLGMALMSRRFNAFVPISVGVLGMCLAGAAIDYPNPYFPYLSLILLTANVLGFFASQLKRCSWLRWLVLIVTMVMLQLWGIRLGILLAKGEPIPPDLAQTWYLPVLGVFFLTFVFLSLYGIVKAGDQKLSRFDVSLPTINVVWAFLLARSVADSGKMNVSLLGFAGLLAVVGLFLIAFWCNRRSVAGAPGTTTFMLAGGALLAMALPTVTGSVILTLPVVSIIAIFIASLSHKWQDGGIRVTAYLLHIYSGLAVALLLQGNSPVATAAASMLPAGIVAAAAIYQYQWCRRWSPPASSRFFEQVDRSDRSAILLFLAGLGASFFTIRTGLLQVLSTLSIDAQKDAFLCAQSVVINMAAIGLILLAYMRSNREIRNVAVLITLVGGIKVFLYDLLGTHGMPLVLSVFSFGLLAAIESLALGKWAKQSARKVP